MFDRNNRNGSRDTTDGSSTTIMVGVRSRDAADVTWVGAVPTIQLCTDPWWAIGECGPASTMVLSHTGSAGIGTLHLPNSLSSMVDDCWSFHRGGCTFLCGEGSVRFVEGSVHPMAFSDRSTRAGGEAVGGDEF